MRARLYNWTCLLLAAALLLGAGLPAASRAQDHGGLPPLAESRPLRPFYPSVSTMETDQLQAVYSRAVIVDVRTPFEYGVVRISKAVNIPLINGDLVQSLSRHRAPESAAPLVFYCNDEACSRAFRAALAAQSAGYENVFVYDAGVFAWLGRHPDRTVLMGATPAQPGQVIPAESFERHRLNFEDFKRRALEPSALVVDIRNLYDRSRMPALEEVRSIPMESFMEAVTNHVWVEKKLLIFDSRGVQTRWLQYFLQANGYVDYYFLQGGMEALDVGTQSMDVQTDTSGVTVSQRRLQEVAADDALASLDRRALNLFTGFVMQENYALVDRQQAALMLDCSDAELLRAAARLKDRGYILFSRQGETLLVHVSPRLAWKGAMEGDIWHDRVDEFDRSGGR